jgi:heme ABC exporter ATP-binding subunit CcmA
MALIEVRDLHKRMGRKPVLRGVNLAVSSGETVALLGANGAGKTTLVRLIAGLAKPDKGSIALDGVPVRRSLPELRRYVGVVTHQPLVYDSLTGMENLLFFARLYGVTNPESRARAALEQVDLSLRRNDLVRTYSRGMVQRLAIARATLHSPPVLLLDEPDTGLDPASAATLQEIIRSLGSAKRAILLTTHNMQRAVAWADSIAILADGKMDARVLAAHAEPAQLEMQILGANHHAR